MLLTETHRLNTNCTENIRNEQLSKIACDIGICQVKVKRQLQLTATKGTICQELRVGY